MAVTVDVANPSQLGANGGVIKFVQRYLDERLDPASNLLENLFECSTFAFILGRHGRGVGEAPVC